MNAKVKAVLFDFNGTMMYDSPIHEAVWLDFIRDHGGKLGDRADYEKHIFGCANRHILSHFLGEDLTEEQIDRYTYEKEAEYRRRCAVDDKVFRLVDGLDCFLDALKAAGYPMTIATGSEKYNVEFYFSSPKLNLNRWFDYSKVVYDDGKFPGKPAPDVYLKAAEKIGVDCRDCIIFEDSYSGVAAARAAGAKYVIALGKDARKELYEKVGGVDAAVEDFTGFRDFPGLEL